MLELGADVHASSQMSSAGDVDIDPPLIVAAKTGNLPLVAMLVEAGAQVDGWQVIFFSVYP